MIQDIPLQANINKQGIYFGYTIWCTIGIFLGLLVRCDIVSAELSSSQKYCNTLSMKL